MEAAIHRPIVFDLAQTRDFDILHGWRETLYALGQLAGDVLGSTNSVVAGLGASSNNNMTISLAAGEIYALANVDTTAYGSLSSDTTQTTQQGFALAQSVILTTAGISSGQSRYTLIYAAFSQTDVIPSDDPNGGVLNYLNSSDPSGPPWSGPSNSGVAQNTRRIGVCTISTVTGSAATTGAEVPPNVPGGGVPLYLVDLVFGQSTIGQSQILPAGPSIGTNVPSNYSGPSFLAGLVKKPTVGSFAGNPNGNSAGTTIGSAGSPAQPNLVWDSTDNSLFVCTAGGSATSAAWAPVAIYPGGIAGRTQIFTASGNFTVPQGVVSVVVEVVGGGGGGGASGDGSAGGVSGNVGGGGGAGGYGYKRISGLTPGSVIAVTIGAGGVAPANSGGGIGGSSSFGGLITCTGGGGGTYGVTTLGLGGPGGTASGADLTIPGGTGGFAGPNVTSVTLSDAERIYSRGGVTGKGFGTVTWSGTGSAGQGYGSGGGGASGGSGTAGGTGASGLVLVEW